MQCMHIVGTLLVPGSSLVEDLCQQGLRDVIWVFGSERNDAKMNWRV